MDNQEDMVVSDNKMSEGLKKMISHAENQGVYDMDEFDILEDTRD